MKQQIEELKMKISSLEKRVDQLEKATAATVTLDGKAISEQSLNKAKFYATTVKGISDIPEGDLNNLNPEELATVKSEKEMLLTSIQKNCRLLNDALESELRKIHNDCPVIVSERCIDLIAMTIQYTQIYLKCVFKFRADTLRNNNYLADDELKK